MLSSSSRKHQFAAERNISKCIREALGTEDTKYNGQRKDFRKFYEACVENLEDLGIDNLQQCVESEELSGTNEEIWDQHIAKVDRNFVYQAIRGALTDNAKHLTKSKEKNGAVLLQYFWKLWAKSTLTNTVAALGELLHLKVNKHSNPTPTFRRIEDIFKDYFENLEIIKTAFLYRVVGKDKYKDILSTLDTKSNMPTFAKLSDQLEKHWLRTTSDYRQDEIENKKKHNNPPGGESTTENRGGRGGRSCRLEH